MEKLHLKLKDIYTCKTYYWFKDLSATPFSPLMFVEMNVYVLSFVLINVRVHMHKESMALHGENNLTKSKMNTANLCRVGTTG